MILRYNNFCHVPSFLPFLSHSHHHYHHNTGLRRKKRKKAQEEPGSGRFATEFRLQIGLVLRTNHRPVPFTSHPRHALVVLLTSVSAGWFLSFSSSSSCFFVHLMMMIEHTPPTTTHPHHPSIKPSQLTKSNHTPNTNKQTNKPNPTIKQNHKA